MILTKVQGQQKLYKTNFDPLESLFTEKNSDSTVKFSSML